MLIAEVALKFQMRKLMRLANRGLEIDTTENGEGPVNTDFRKWLAENPEEADNVAHYDDFEADIILNDHGVEDPDECDEIFEDSDDESVEEFI